MSSEQNELFAKIWDFIFNKTELEGDNKAPGKPGVRPNKQKLIGAMLIDLGFYIPTRHARGGCCRSE
jgi:hypothetical protein